MADRLPSQTALEPSPPAAATPVRLGRYELISQLAKGGMGAVYLARTRGKGGFERLVVVKCALPSLADSTQQMLLAEARLAATLQHSNIVQVHDVDTDGATVFLAMEFLHGQDARQVLRRSLGQGRPLPVESAVAIALAVCAGLHYAHDKRDTDGQPLEIVHRDVSPSNVFITYDGSVKLIDFGIAKATALPSETQLGSVKGKPGYMSPEQCRCEPLDRRSDVFCIGILLYELTLGRKPFRADNEYLLYKQIIEVDPPRPREIDPAYPPALEAIVMRALAKDRRARQPTAKAVQDELSAFASAQRLDVSQFALGRYMAELFADELAAWHHALHAGQSLVEHVIKRTTSTMRIIDGAGATGTGDPRAPAVTASLPPTSPERPMVPAARRRWPYVVVAVSVVAVAGIGIAVFGPSDSAHRTDDPHPTAPIGTNPTASPPSPTSTPNVAAPSSTSTASPTPDQHVEPATATETKPATQPPGKTTRPVHKSPRPPPRGPARDHPSTRKPPGPDDIL